MGRNTTAGPHKGKLRFNAAAAALRQASPHYAAVMGTMVAHWNATNGEAAKTGRPGTPLPLLGLIFNKLFPMAMKSVDGVKVFASVANVACSYEQVRMAARSAYDAWAPTAPEAERARASKLRWTDSWVKTFLTYCKVAAAQCDNDGGAMNNNADGDLSDGAPPSDDGAGSGESDGPDA